MLLLTLIPQQFRVVVYLRSRRDGWRIGGFEGLVDVGVRDEG